MIQDVGLTEKKEGKETAQLQHIRGQHREATTPLRYQINLGHLPSISGDSTSLILFLSCSSYDGASMTLY